MHNWHCDKCHKVIDFSNQPASKPTNQLTKTKQTTLCLEEEGSKNLYSYCREAVVLSPGAESECPGEVLIHWVWGGAGIWNSDMHHNLCHQGDSFVFLVLRNRFVSVF